MATRSRRRPPATPASTNKADERWRVFCDEYVKDHNKTQAALRAGYSKSGACVQAIRLLRNANVRERIAELEREVAQRNQLQVDRLVQEAQKIAFCDLGKLLIIEEDQVKLRPLSEIDTSVLAGITIKTATKDGVTIQEISVKPHSKLQGIRTLMQYLGALKEHVEVTGAGGGPVQTETAAIQAAVDRVLPDG